MMKLLGTKNMKCTLEDNGRIEEWSLQWAVKKITIKVSIGYLLVTAVDQVSMIKIMLLILVISNILFIFCMRFTNYFEMSFIQNAIIDCQRTTGLNAHSDVLNWNQDLYVGRNGIKLPLAPAITQFLTTSALSVLISIVGNLVTFAVRKTWIFPLLLSFQLS